MSTVEAAEDLVCSSREQFERDGYVVFERLMTTEQVDAVREALAPHLAEDLTGRNNFEGLHSNRVYGLLAKSPVFAEMVTHPLALSFAQAELGDDFLLSALLAINLQPGETPQPWHFDTGHSPAPPPHQGFGVSTFWAIDDTTEDNGATEVIPGSHRWDGERAKGEIHDRVNFREFHQQSVDPDDDPGRHPDAVKVIMPAGSMMVAKGSLWHRGGANRSDGERMIVTPQYCAGWLRQLENMVLAVPPSEAGAYPPRVRQLLGYSIYSAFMGYVNGMHPDRTVTGV